VTSHDDAAAVDAWLRAGADRVIETSCARIYLAAGRALKVKKAVDFGFLDFSTLEKRRWAITRELAFNRRNAPDLYRQILPITRGEDGALTLGGDGAAVEWALEMRRFNPDAVLSNHPEAVDDNLAESLGRAIARAHAGAEITPDGGGAAALGYTVSTNADHLRVLSALLGDAAARVIEGTDAALEARAALLEARRAAGFARHCHGDLHLANILLENGVPVLFDCIEFNDRLSRIDILYDLAFLIMDLDFRGRARAANRVLNAYLDEAARSLPAEIWDGLAALPLMLSARATVRAHVSASTADANLAKAYLAAAERHLAPPAPRLFAVGGLSGSGKTTFARALAPQLPGSPGAVVLRSDEIRKRLWSAGPLDRLPREAYAPETHARVYGELFMIAARLLAAGRCVVLDAAFLAHAEREGAEGIARAAGAPFQGVWLQGDPSILRARLAARKGDASDADARVLDSQLERDLGEVAWRRVGAQADFEAEARGLQG
jgi:aminoglycoside phosphotransferase family enzyme/predicted kinase